MTLRRHCKTQSLVQILQPPPPAPISCLSLPSTFPLYHLFHSALSYFQTSSFSSTASKYMPHAEKETMSTTATETMGPTVNGQTSTYKSLDHLASYPIISDSISTFKTYPIGQRSIDITHSAYCTFIAPLSPYLSKAAPYVNRADELAESGLGKIEERFPIVKEPTENIKNTVVDTIGYPRKLAGEVYVRGTDIAKDTKEYVFSIYDDELARQQNSENKGGYIPRAKAGVTTGWVVSSELMGAIASYLGSKKDQAKVKVDETKK